MGYKVENKADGWYVAGVRHATQKAATKALIALLSGKAVPKRTAAQKPRPSHQAASRKMYPKGPGLVSGSIFEAKDAGTWKLAEGLRGINIKARADGEGYVSVGGHSIAVTGVFEEPKASPKMAPAPKRKRAFAQGKLLSDLDGFSILGFGEDVKGLVNGEVLGGHAAKVIGEVKYPPKGMNPDVTSVVLIAKKNGAFDVLLFDDEAVSVDTVYRNIPTRYLADRMAHYLWASFNRHALRVDRELIEAMQKYHRPGRDL